MRLLVPALLACAGCSTFVEHRAALVPHATSVQNIGQPNEWKTSASLAATNVADLQRPGVGNPDAGVAIPARQFRGSFTLGITRNFSLAFMQERGLASSAQPIKDTLPPLDDTSLVGTGTAMSYSFATHSPWRVGISLELMAWSVPYVEYATCVQNCGGSNYTIVTHDTIPVLTAALGVVPSYRADNWIFFGGLTVRNHPTVEEKVITNGYSNDVEGGPANATIHAGVAYDASDRVRFMLEMHHTLTSDPVAYAPAIGFGFELGLGPRHPPPRPEPVSVQSTSPGYVPDPDPVQAAQLAQEAHKAAQAGECDQVRALMARVQQLDTPTYANAMHDKLIAYCVTP
jgi:hypothetical protein